MRALIASFLLVTTAAAQTPRLPDFGAPAINATIAAIPAGARRLPHCFETPAFIDCEYELGGVLYLVYGHAITRKRIEVSAASRFPFGLNASQTPLEVRAALASQFGSAEISRRDDLTFVYAEPLTVVFAADGRMRELILGYSTPED